jgi:hypothetical protein
MNTVYVITHSQRGDEGAGVLSVHITLDGAKAALIKWAHDQWDEEDVEGYLKEYLMDDGKGLCTEEDMFLIMKESVLP